MKTLFQSEFDAINFCISLGDQDYYFNDNDDLSVHDNLVERGLISIVVEDDTEFYELTEIGELAYRCQLAINKLLNNNA